MKPNRILLTLLPGLLLAVTHLCAQKTRKNDCKYDENTTDEFTKKRKGRSVPAVVTRLTKKELELKWEEISSIYVVY